MSGAQDKPKPGPPKRAVWEQKPEQDDPLPTLDQSPVVKWLLGLNLILHAINEMLPVVIRDRWGQVIGQMGLLTKLGNFNVVEAINQHQLWRLFTYQFLHAHLLHLGMNMMALYVFGPLIEKWWGSKRFLAFYLLCGACGAWLMALLSFFPSLINAKEDWLVGASGSIFGVLVAVAMLYPKVEVKLIIPPMWITVRKLAIVFIGISFVSMFIGYNLGGNAAHLGGAVFGYILVRRPWSLDFVAKDAPKLDPPPSMRPLLNWRMFLRPKKPRNRMKYKKTIEFEVDIDSDREEPKNRQ